MGKICMECMEFVSFSEKKIAGGVCPNCGNTMKEKYNKIVKEAIKTYFTRLLEKN